MNELVEREEIVDGCINHILVNPVQIGGGRTIVSVRSDSLIGVGTPTDEGIQVGFISLNAALRLAPEISSVTGNILC